MVALVPAAALLRQCQFFLSEDLQGDQVIDGMRIVNPFALSPLDLSM